MLDRRKQLSIILIGISIIIVLFSYPFYKKEELKVNNLEENPSYFSFLKVEKDGTESKLDTMPDKNSGYTLDLEKSSCNNGATLGFDGLLWQIKVSNLTKTKTKCKLYFKPRPTLIEQIEEEYQKENGVYLVKHEENYIEACDSLSCVGYIPEINDKYKKSEYRYKGVNPKNYLQFNDELWRIIGLVNVKIHQDDGSEKIEQRVKIIRNSPLEEPRTWENYGEELSINDYDENINPLSYLNKSYFNTIKTDDQNMIENVDWNSYDSLAGEIDYYGNSVATKYFAERQITDDVNPYLNAYIALPYLSDYGYSLDNSNLLQEKCYLNNGIFNWNNENLAECRNNNWFYLTGLQNSEWTLNYFFDFRTFKIVTSILSINEDGSIENVDLLPQYDENGEISDMEFRSRLVRPTLYLKPSVIVMNGDGSINNAYVVSFN